MDRYQELADLIITKAIGIFNEKEKFLLEYDVSERCMCSRLALYITKEMEQYKECMEHDYVVDVEYNRGFGGNSHASKMLEGKKIVVDIIVHKREADEVIGFDNFICIEMKKDNDTREAENGGIDADKERLEKLTNLKYGFNYKVGYMLLANVTGNKEELQLSILNTYYLHDET